MQLSLVHMDDRVLALEQARADAPARVRSQFDDRFLQCVLYHELSLEGARAELEVAVLDEPPHLARGELFHSSERMNLRALVVVVDLQGFRSRRNPTRL